MTKTPDIWMLHTSNPREGESQWRGCYIVEADAHNDAATMRKATGLDWEVVPMVRADSLGKCLLQIAEPAAAPFMYAIADGYGNAFFEEQGCVSSEAKDLQPEVDSLNQNLDGEPPYRVVALHTHPAQISAVQATKVVEALTMLENGALNVAENAKNRGDDYGVGYAQAMAKMARDTLDVLSAPAHPAEGVPAQAFKTKVYQALGIGSECDEHVAFVNIENLIRREHCLSAIEREFFMVEMPPDKDEGETEPGEECLLNWGSTPEQYVKQFAEALAATHPTQQGLDAIAALEALVRDADSEPDGDYLDGAGKNRVAVHRKGIELARAIAAQAKQGGAA